jgi:glycine C-acetyltransferase
MSGEPHRAYDPFDGFFEDGVVPADRLPGSLRGPRARRWFDVVGWGVDTGLYTYQQPLSGRSGAHVRVGERDLLMLSSYDYLGLIGHPDIEREAAAAIAEYGTGTGGVRLLTGTNRLHCVLEKEIAAFKGVEAAITFSSGYLANIAAIGALTGPDDRVVLDARAHRSLVDSCRISRAKVQRFHHNDVDSLERELRKPTGAPRTLVVVEGVYSMDGDVCPLRDIVALKRRYDFTLMVDESHSLGVIGPRGRGIDEHLGVAATAVDVWAGSLAKAIPAGGGYLAASRAIVVYLQHEAAPFMFSAALVPSAAAAARASLRVIDAEPWRLERLGRNAKRLRSGLRGLGFDTGASETPIIPVIFGDETAAWSAARRLFDLDLFTTAVVNPAVPRGSARLRLCAMAAHTDADIDRALDAFARLGRSS